MKCTFTILSLTLVVGCAAGLVFFAPSEAATPMALPQYNSDQDAQFLASEAARDRWMESVRLARVDAARNGIEYRLAGFHLIRPDDDPHWEAQYGQLGCSGNIYCWDYPQLRYPDIEYSVGNLHGLPPPSPGSLPSFCQLSLERLFSDGLASLAVQNDGSLKKVVATFDARSISALSAMLAPKSNEPTFGLIDWFGTPRVPGAPVTAMRAALVSDNLAYLPFSIQDILSQGPGPTAIVVANALSDQEASALVEKYH